jgi:Fur family transcriptional regulator, ferric uptake regulator
MPKRTRSQERILHLLKHVDGALSAQEIYLQLRQQEKAIGLATVYRALDGLKLEGVLQVRSLANGEAVYSTTQSDRHHLTCLQCGASVVIEDCPVHQLEEELNQSYRFKIFYHTLEFFGLCTQCQAQCQT